MAFRVKRRLLGLVTAVLFAMSSVGHVYAATQALMKMPAAAMEASSSDHGMMDCGGKDKASRADCVALCATANAILPGLVAPPFTIVHQGMEAEADLPPPSRSPSPEPPPPRR